MTTTRTDAHRPSAPEFDPQSYSWTGDVVDFNPEEGTSSREAGWFDADQTIESLMAVGWSWATAHSFELGYGAQCQHCGAHLRYAALLKHEATKEMLWVGETCLDNRFSGMTKAQFDHLRKTAMLARDAVVKLAAFNEFLANHPEIVPATYVYNMVFLEDQQEFGHEKYGTGWATSVIADILSKLRQYGSISDKQIAFVVKLITEVEEKINNYVEPIAAGPAPRGKQTVEGTIVGFKSAEGYMPGTTVTKMMIQFENGSKAYGTCPASLEMDQAVNKGTRVQFSANFEAPRDGAEDMAFFKRPIKAVVL